MRITFEDAVNRTMSADLALEVLTLVGKHKGTVLEVRDIPPALLGMPPEWAGIRERVQEMNVVEAVVSFLQTVSDLAGAERKVLERELLRRRK